MEVEVQSCRYGGCVGEGMEMTGQVRVERREVGGGMGLEVGVCGEKGGEVVVMLHGFPDYWRTWAGYLEGLAGRGCRVLAPNMRGYGGSGKPSGVGAYDLDLLAGEVVGLIRSEGVERRVTLVGHDWGGMVAWWVAACMPEVVKGLVVINAPHPGVVRGYMAGHWGQILRSGYAGFFQLPWLPEVVNGAWGGWLPWRLMNGSARAGAFGAEERGAYRAAWGEAGTWRGMIHYYRALFRRREGTLRKRVRVPTVVVWGVKDWFLQRGVAEASVGMCEDGRVVWFVAGTHWVHREERAGVMGEIAGMMGLGEK